MPTGYSRRNMLGMAAAVGGLSIRQLRAAAAPRPEVPDFASLTLEQQVGQMVIARFQDWPLMERYVKQGLVSGMTPSLPKNSPAEVAEFTVERSVQRVWRLKQDLGLFERRLVDPGAIEEVFGSRESGEVARRIAQESVTLLENGLPPPRNAKLVVVSNGSSPTVDEDTAFRHSPMNHHLAEAIRKRAPAARSITLSTAMGSEEMAAAFDAVREADVVVFGLFTRVRSYVEDAIRVPKAFQGLIGRTLAAGRAVALLNFGNPYVFGDLPQAALALAAFSDEKDSVEASVAVLFGEREPGGRLPVRVSDRYPFGHGLERSPAAAPAGK